MERPDWLNKKIDIKEYDRMRARLKPYGLHTVCEEARCPNISECFAKNTATFLILGDVCTRKCLFCGVKKGSVNPPDISEPSRVAGAVVELGLKYAVITGVTRDDLPDRGSAHYAEVVKVVKNTDDSIRVELLIPDFDGLRDNIAAICAAGPDVIGHNIETVRRLYEYCGRDEYRYEVSLSTLETIKSVNKEQKTKSGIMLGLGETEEEVIETMNDLREVNCDLLSIGQYLSPSSDCVPVAGYITPEKFVYYKDQALNMGFEHVMSGPYVRSSYLADEYVV